MTRLRFAAPSDAAAIAAIYAPFVADTWVSFEELAPTPAEIATRIAALHGRLPWLVADVDGTLAGYANALAGIAIPNDASVAFHESAGFASIGVYHHIGFKAGA